LGQGEIVWNYSVSRDALGDIYMKIRPMEVGQGEIVWNYSVSQDALGDIYLKIRPLELGQGEIVWNYCVSQDALGDIYLKIRPQELGQRGILSIVSGVNCSLGLPFCSAILSASAGLHLHSRPNV
jgi:hypothetical protein